MSEYVFGKSRGNFKNASTKTLSIEGDISKLILEQYDHYINLKNNDSILSNLSRSIETISSAIVSNVGVLQSLPKGNEAEKINIKLGVLNTEHTKLKSEFDSIVKVELSIIYEHYPDLFEMIINGLDRNTLENVLNAFSEFSKGNISKTEAVSKGVSFMTTKYSLPKDFFNPDALTEYTK